MHGMHASGIFTAGMIVGGSFGIVATLAIVAAQKWLHNRRYRDKSAEAEHLRKVARTAIAAHRGHHERRGGVKGQCAETT